MAAEAPPSAHALWIHDTLQEVFCLCLVKTQAGDGGTSVVLPDLDATLPGPLHPKGGHLLTAPVAEAALVECLATQPDAGPYLTACWERARDLRDAEPQLPSHAARLEVLRECVRLAAAYVALHCQHDDLFNDSRVGGSKLVHALATSSRAGDLLEDVLRALPAGHAGDQLVVPAATALTEEVGALSIADDWQTFLKVLSTLTAPEAACKAILAGLLWLPEGNGHALEHRSLLGAFFALSATNARARAAFLPTDDKGHVAPDYQWPPAALEHLRGHWGLLVELLHGALMQGFLRPKYARESFLRWLAAALNRNAERAKTHVDYASCGSDCFMLTLTGVLLLLVDPVIAKDREKRDAVAPGYASSPHGRLSYERFTRIAMNADQAAKAVAAHASGPREFGFSTEAFFFAFHALHLGPLAASTHWTQTNEEVRELKRAMEAAAAPGGQGLAPLLLEFQTSQFRAQYSERVQLKFALDALLFNPKLVRSVFRFCDFAAVWLLRVAFGTLEDDFRRPLPAVVPDAFAALPEYFVDTLADVLLFYLHHGPRFHCITPDLDMRHLVQMVVCFMPAASYITNPYVRKKFPELLYVVAMIEQQVSRAGFRSSLADIFHTAVDPALLVQGLMRLYVDMENLGGHNQFYEKFTPRYYVAELFTYLWAIPQYQQAFKQEATDRLKARIPDHFVKFFNYMLNDANFLMEESLTCLKQINEFEQLQANAAAWNALSQTERADKTKAVEETKGKCKSFMRLGSETVNMMEYLSAELPAPFLAPELVDKVAAMLAYFLETLAGRSLNQLKVSNAKEYNFNHRVLIEKICHTFVNFSPYPAFHRAMASEGRSYSPENFAHALAFLRSKALLGPPELELLESLGDKFKAACQENQMADDMYGEDVPDHFLDPINCSVMTDPVKLPTSGQVVERAVIIRHLLNDEIDPFNRAPLTVSALEDHNAKPEVQAEMAALRREIEAWRPTVG